MTCISPPEPEDRLLMAFLDGEADPDTILHLEKCPYCRDRIASLAREQKLLTSQLFRSTCPSATELGEYHLHLLSSDRMLIISEHLRDCPYCTKEISQLGEFLSDLGPDPETNLVGHAKMLFAKLVAGGKASRPNGEPAYALRGDIEGPMTFEVSGVLVVIDMQETGDGKLNLFGQVAADQQDDWTNATVLLSHEGHPEHKTTVDDLGAFQFNDLPAGTMDLRVEARDGTVVVVPTFEGSD